MLTSEDGVPIGLGLFNIDGRDVVSVPVTPQARRAVAITGEAGAFATGR
jgi:hypothetical protein